MRKELYQSQEKHNEQIIIKRIRRDHYILKKSIDLLKKIEETNDEKYIQEYQKLYLNIKQN